MAEKQQQQTNKTETNRFDYFLATLLHKRMYEPKLNEFFEKNKLMFWIPYSSETTFYL